jgi:L-2-hydroxyglutarate oxidase
MQTGFYDIAVIGGGIVGLSTALAVKERFPDYSLAVIEKESEVAAHQTGRNSGVIHSGIYYKPGSQKARLCVEGARLMYAFCSENNVPFDRCGKLVVATTEQELPRLQTLYERGTANGIEGLEIIGPDRAREIEPCVRAVQALYSPNTGITDYRQVARAMADRISGAGDAILLSSRVLKISNIPGDPHVETTRGDVRCRFLINCAGLYSDRIARMTGPPPTSMIVPFRGEYYTLAPGNGKVRNLIYPVPDPQFPFLGVHFTRRIDGTYEAGPNAVLAFAREGYKFGNFNWKDMKALLTYSGFWAMARRYWRVEIFELYRSLSRSAFLAALQKLVPELEDRDITRGGAGVRAQVVTSNGSLADDFIITESRNCINVLNAPSPAATASIAIGRHIADLAFKNFR